MIFSPVIVGGWMLFVGIRKPEERDVFASVGGVLLVLQQRPLNVGSEAQASHDSHFRHMPQANHLGLIIHDARGLEPLKANRQRHHRLMEAVPRISFKCFSARCSSWSFTESKKRSFCWYSVGRLCSRAPCITRW